MAQDISANAIVDRAINVSRLDVPTYDTIERDPRATTEAAIVVGVVAVAGAIGGATDGFGGILVGLISAFIGWVVFSYLAYFFGKNIFGTPTTDVRTESLLRTIGYAQAPGALAITGFVPLIGWIGAFVGGVWSIVTAVIAIRQGLDVSTGRAILVAIVAAIATGIVSVILSMIFGIGVSF